MGGPCDLLVLFFIGNIDLIESLIPILWSITKVTERKAEIGFIIAK